MAGFLMLGRISPVQTVCLQESTAVLLCSPPLSLLCSRQVHIILSKQGILCRQLQLGDEGLEQVAPADPEALSAPGDILSVEERVKAASAKVVDFGNACWVHKQFTSDIQTRQYRCPEVSFSQSKLAPEAQSLELCIVVPPTAGEGNNEVIVVHRTPHDLPGVPVLDSDHLRFPIETHS